VRRSARASSAPAIGSSSDGADGGIGSAAVYGNQIREATDVGDTTSEQCEQHEGDHVHLHNEACGHEDRRHGDHQDYEHDGHWHAKHQDHWDEHEAA
jgi:hypothetical protein